MKPSELSVYDLRQAAMTKRCHTVPTIGHQTVGEHSYHVAMLCIELASGVPSARLLMAALYHDLAEISTGDVPAHVKWRALAIKCELEALEREFESLHGLTVLLSDNEKLILKYADSLELAFYCVDQLMYGNKHVLQMYHNIKTFIDKLPPLATAQPIIERLEKAYVCAR